MAFDAELANALAIETEDGFGEATEFLHGFFSGTAKQRARLVPKAPLAAIQRAALVHQDPFMRRGCLFFLDHYANDESMGIFARALRDPVVFVRNAALHSLTCGTCKRADLCVADVVPALIDVLEHDLSVEMRTKAIPLLLMLSGQDSRAKPAVERAAQVDPDELIRRACADGLAGRFVAPRKRYERRQRRHARTAASRQRA